MSRPFRIELLSAAHDREEFSSGSDVLDRYFREQAGQDARRRVTNCFVAIGESGDVVGFYTLAAASLPLLELSAEEARKLPRYPLLPACLIGRLAVGLAFQGRGLGGALIIDAASRASRSDPAVFAMVVEAKDAAAEAFYDHLGFRRFASRPDFLFLPLATALRALGG